MKRLGKYILFISIFVIFIGIAVLHFIKAHNLVILEMQEQIDKFGFYKSDFTINVNRYYLFRWILVGGILNVLFGIIPLLAYIINDIINN